MKYSEFKAEVEKMGYECVGDVRHSDDYVKVLNRKTTFTVAAISKNYEYRMSTDRAMDELSKDLFNLIVSLAKTPLAEREEEKRYYLRNVSPLLRGSGRGYLAKNKDTLEYYALSLKCSEEFYQTIFTESEIAEMDINGFEKIEVSE